MDIALTEWHLQTSVHRAHTCYLVYRSADGLIGLHVTSGGKKADRRRYFLWALPDSAPEYATEAEAREAHAVAQARAERDAESRVRGRAVAQQRRQEGAR